MAQRPSRLGPDGCADLYTFGCATPPFRILYALYAPPESLFRVVITGRGLITKMYPGYVHKAG
eukprot:3355706-Pyramimonas_sp.AAC.1